MGETSCCTNCSRTLLVIVNFVVMVDHPLTPNLSVIIFQAAGLALIAANFYANYNQQFEPNLKLALYDANPNPYEMYTLKNNFRLVVI